MTLALSLFLIGAGAVHWAKTLMPDHEVIQERHELRSSDEDRQGVIEVFREGAEAAGLGRRSLIKRSLLGSVGLISLTPILLLRDLGPLPGKQLETTNWEAGRRLVTDPDRKPLKASDLQVGAVAHILPEMPEGSELTLEDLFTHGLRSGSLRAADSSFALSLPPINFRCRNRCASNFRSFSSRTSAVGNYH